MFIKFDNEPHVINDFADFIITECEKKHLNLYLKCIKNLEKIKQSSLRMSII